MRARMSIMVLSFVVIIAAGCGETISADTRIERCLGKQPGATEVDCKQWEKAGELEDNGRHRGHGNM